MSKPYYADYVNHILRFYFRYDRNKGFKNDVDRMNYLSADRVIQRLSKSDVEILSLIYNEEGINLVENIKAVTNKVSEDPVRIWSLVSTITSKVAKERKLL